MENNNHHKRTWHHKHKESMGRGENIADALANFMGSWKFIILQTVIVIVWFGVNIFAYLYRWDPYPFILLNLIFSIEAAYAGPIIMMTQNRQAERDRVQALEDYHTNLAAKEEIEELQVALTRIESKKLDKIIELLDKADK